MTPPRTLCRDCFSWQEAGEAPEEAPTACAACASPRIVSHPEIAALTVAHIDCDAFFASVEKRDDPSLIGKPVIVGGGRRGVVSAACYIARIDGVRSAMPMFKALQACPEAVVIRPDIAKYTKVGRAVRKLMEEVTPLVEPLSIDEAFLDLAGSERLHKGPPAETLARLVARIEAEIGITASIGLSFNKFLAKLASDLDKPRGFSIIGEAEATRFLAPRPVSAIWGVGKSLHTKLRRDGIRTIADLQAMDEGDLAHRYGAMGRRLADFSRARDARRVNPERVVKSVSNETTFEADLADLESLRAILWPLCEQVSGRLKASAIAGRVVTLKLRRSDFQIITRRVTLPSPTQLAEVIFRTSLPLLERALDGQRYRLLGVGVSGLESDRDADPLDLADPLTQKRRDTERAIDAVRRKLGPGAIEKGRGLKQS